jgi:hypothetical protein
MGELALVRLADIIGGTTFVVLLTIAQAIGVGHDFFKRNIKRMLRPLRNCIGAY